MSTGEETGSALQPVNTKDASEDLEDTTIKPANDGVDIYKPSDWNNVEGATCTGTYCFSDYPVFLQYKSTLAHQMVEMRNWNSQRDVKGKPKHDADCPITAPERLLSSGEITGDCLGLRLTLKPTAEQLPESEKGVLEAEEFGPDDPEFPMLRFEGQAFTYSPEDDPRQLDFWQRQTLNFAQGDDAVNGMSVSAMMTTRTPTQRYMPAIAGIQWRIVPAYERGDGWSLSGIQAGPPGTRAPVYDLWSDVSSVIGTHLGPFAYFSVDSRPWTEFEAKVDEIITRFEVDRSWALQYQRDDDWRQQQRRQRAE